MIILGIDPGLNTTGYGVLESVSGQPRLVEAGVVRSKASGSLASRVQEIHDGVADVIASLKPEVLAIEELYSHYERPTTAILMGHARGVILLTAAAANIPVVNYPATQIKKTITGNGHAAKWQMQEAIRRELNLPTLPEPPDVADALAIALCHCYLSRTQLRHPEGIRDCGLRIDKPESTNPYPQSEIRDPKSTV
jgi:crossover junction endodeoxyribonuclease RuvC